MKGGDGKSTNDKRDSRMSTSSAVIYIKVQSMPGTVKIIQKRNPINCWKMLE